MKKLMFLFVSLLTLTMTSCGDNDEPFSPYNLTYGAAFYYLPAEGGVTEVNWTKGIMISDFKTISYATWIYDPIAKLKPIEPWEELDFSNENDVIKGEWFVITPNGARVNNAYQGIAVALSPNTTGKRRCLKISTEIGDISDAYIYQDCEETEE